MKKRFGKMNRSGAILAAIVLAVSGMTGCGGETKEDDGETIAAWDAVEEEEKDTDGKDSSGKEQSEEEENGETEAEETEAPEVKTLAEEYPGYVEILKDYYSGKRGIVGYDWNLDFEDQPYRGWNEATGGYEYYYLLKDVDGDQTPELFVSYLYPYSESDYMTEGVFGWRNGTVITFRDYNGESNYKFEVQFKKDLVWMESYPGGEVWYRVEGDGGSTPFMMWDNGVYEIEGQSVTEEEWEQEKLAYDQPCEEIWTPITGQELERLGAEGPFPINSPAGAAVSEELDSPAPLSPCVADLGYIPSGFYGVWCGASQDESQAQKLAEEVTAAGFAGCYYLSSDWSNLNEEPWYVVAAAVSDSEEGANTLLRQVQTVYPDAYVKYTGECRGSGN